MRIVAGSVGRVIFAVAAAAGVMVVVVAAVVDDRFLAAAADVGGGGKGLIGAWAMFPTYCFSDLLYLSFILHLYQLFSCLRCINCGDE